MGIAERKEREKEQRANAIIDAAEKVFFERGLENATMDEVAERAELSKGTLYLYFKNKEAIVFEIFRRALSLLMSKFNEVYQEEQSGFENLLNVGRAFIEFSKVSSNYFSVMGHFEMKHTFETEDCSCGASTDGSDKHKNMCDCCEFNKQDNCPMAALSRIIVKGMEDGSIRKDIEPVLLAHLLWLQTMGVLQLAKASKSHLQVFGIEEEQIIRGYLDLLTDGIKGRE